jgi:hypothetical protein
MTIGIDQYRMRVVLFKPNRQQSKMSEDGKNFKGCTDLPKYDQSFDSRNAENWDEGKFVYVQKQSLCQKAVYDNLPY